MASNSAASLRNRLYGGANYIGNAREVPSDLPEWLRSQYETQTSGSDAGSETSFWGPGASLRDSQGRAVLLLNDDGSSSHEDRQINEGAEGHRYYDPELGWVIPVEHTNEDKFDARMRRNRIIAASIIGGVGALGAAGIGAAGAGAAEGVGGLAATIPGDIALGGGVAGSIPLAEIPAITSLESLGGLGGAAAGGGGGLAGLGQAAGGGGGLAATIPGDIAVGGGGIGGSAALADIPAITQAGGGSGMSGIVDALGGPSGIARGIGGLAALGASRGGGSGSGETDPQNIIDQMANANRVDHNTPIGNRRWSQDPATGRWAVNDSMSPVEQANFEQVQGLNSSVTQMARDRLAALLAQGPRQRYDRPLGT